MTVIAQINLVSFNSFLCGMNYLSVEELSKSFDEKLLFSGITFGLDQGQKAALVGVNGCGKSTLLRVIAGQETPEKGMVSFRNGIRVSILNQHPDFEEEDTVRESVFDSSHDELNVISNYEEALYITENDPENAPDLAPIIEEMDRLNAWEYEQQIKQILGKLGIHDLSQKMKELSGGQKKRVALAQALVVKADFLILDEPTNHLDLEIIEWLENYLATQNLTLLMVTHDRYFLERVTNEIIELERGVLHRYKGSYSNFLEKKAEREAIEQASVDKAKNLMRTELEWIRRQPKARGTKAKYRVDAFDDLKEKATGGTKTASMEVNLAGQRLGKKILEMKDIMKSFGKNKMVEDFNYVFKRGERVGLVGPNGVGKSTFLNILTGQLKPDQGELDMGQTIKVGYYAQDETIFDPNKKVIEIIKEVAEFITLEDGREVSASNLLNQFLFDPKMQYNLVGKLSGGEKRRLQLLRVLMGNPNFLILDEPTNDLDIMTLNVLEDYLHKFGGCLMIVSHDRYFMDRLVDHLFIFEGDGRIRDFPGNYSDYRLQLPKSVTSKEETSEKETSVLKQKSSTDKLSYKEKLEFEKLEKEISELEERKADLQSSLNNETEYQKLEEISKEIQEIMDALESREMRWLELSERPS